MPKICRAMRLFSIFISCLNASRASFKHDSVPYRKTVLTHALAICSCLLMGRCGRRFRRELVAKVAVVANFIRFFRCAVVVSSLLRWYPRYVAVVLGRIRRLWLVMRPQVCGPPIMIYSEVPIHLFY